MPTVVTLRLPNTDRVHWRLRWKKDVYPSEPRRITVFWSLDMARKRVRNSGKSRTRGVHPGEKRDTSECAETAERTAKMENAESLRDQFNLNFNQLESTVYKRCVECLLEIFV